uniref:Putative effector protein n=1 Tax=Heterodera avenae TaxID=34510 RepID=A0A2L0VDP1_HETAV|nr:putative effector protein [Heterodera avenae]
MLCANLMRLSLLASAGLYLLLISGTEAQINPDKPMYFRSDSNSLIVAAMNSGADPLAARGTFAGEWEKFQLIKNSDGTISFLSLFNRKYVCADIDRGDRLIANKDWNQVWERFYQVDNADGTISLRANVNNKYVSADQHLPNATLVANRGSIGPWEKFRFYNYEN